jgi:3-dehydroquinate synthase
MLAAARISNRLGILDIKEMTRLENLIKRTSLITEMPPSLEPGRIIQAMKHDKKIAGGKMRFILPRAIGDVFITDEVNLSLVKEVLTA